jgi:hypothetical protein
MTRYTIGLLLVLLSGCAQQPAQQPLADRRQPQDFPAAFYLHARQAGKPVYWVDPEQSAVIMHVYPAGKLARLGHEHIIASHDIQGFLLWSGDWRRRRLDLYMPLPTLSVDQPELRKAYGLESQPSPQAVEGTRDNMLRKTLLIDENRFVKVHATQLNEAADPITVDARLVLNKAHHRKTIEAKVARNGSTLEFSGAFEVLQSDFGLTPFTALGGLLQVRDAVEVRFHIVVKPLSDDDYRTTETLRAK